jgi:hypothetical protein
LLLGTIGVLVTRGAPSVIHPEQVLTFRVEAPVTFSTAIAPNAFHWIQPGEYDRPVYASAPRPAPRPYYAYAGPVVYAPYPYPYYYSPFWYGPSVGFFFRGGHYYRGGWRR